MIKNEPFDNHNKMKIIFICKYNRFRSKFAEAYFNKKNKNKKIKVSSGGIIVGNHILHSNEKKTFDYVKKKFDIKIKIGSKGLTTDQLAKQDLIIVVADDVPEMVFNYEKYLGKLKFWRIPDEQKSNEKNIDFIGQNIMKNVDDLIKSLGIIK